MLDDRLAARAISRVGGAAARSVFLASSIMTGCTDIGRWSVSWVQWDDAGTESVESIWGETVLWCCGGLRLGTRRCVRL